MNSTKKILVIGNGYIADNFIFYYKDIHDITVYARSKYTEYDNVSYVYGAIEDIDILHNNYDNVFILFGYSRPSIPLSLNEVIYTNVYLVAKILDFASKNMSRIFYPATSLSLSIHTCKLNYYSYSHTVTIDMIKQSNVPYTICYLHNIFGNLTNTVKKNKMVIDNFIDCYHTKQPVQLINNGQQRRIFTHISDVVNFMGIAMNLDNKEINLVHHNKMYSIKEIAELLELSTILVETNLYSLEDPYILPINDIEGWTEYIDIKEWITQSIKI